jgi:hypothetical protein
MMKYAIHNSTRSSWYSEILIATLLLAMLVVPIQVRAAVSVDTDGFTINVNDSAGVSAIQPDGKIHISGNFTEVDGIPRNGFARLNPDGSLDPSFNPNVNDSIRVNAIQSDGKMLVSGNFTEIDGVARNGFARLHIDGSLDSNFTPNINGQATVSSLGNDGKMLISGSFTEIDGMARSGVKITAECAGERLVIFVDNDGDGIPETLRQDVLKRGRRLDEKVPGSGLGLDIVRDIAELYRGSLHLEQSELGGVGARLDLPAV